MHNLLRLSCAAAIAVACSQARAAEKQMPIDFVGEWCSPSTFEGKTKYTLPSWTDEGKCTDILSIEKWGFTFSEKEGGKTCLPTTIRTKQDTAPSGTAYLATINARCLKGGVLTSGSGTPETFEFQRYKGSLTINAPLDGPNIASKQRASVQQLSRDQIFELQFRLNQLGFEVGEPNGQVTSRTQQASAAFARKAGLDAELNSAILEQARTASADIQGFARKDGSVDLLVFTDEGFAQIARIEDWGLINKSNSKTYVRDHDRDGRPLYAEHFDVSSMERRDDIPLVQWVSFGYKIYFPTPPTGQRLEIEQIIIRPRIRADGSVERATIVIKNPLLKAPPPGPWYWYTGIDQDPDPRLEGDWTMTIGQKGKVLISRTFSVRRR